ncbi:MAG: aspartate aminotransferase family protein [Dermatophilaceae bacterium]
MSHYPVWHPMTRMSRFVDHEVMIESGHDTSLRGRDGERYLSANSGLWNVCAGLDEDLVVDAVREQLARLPYSTLFRFSHPTAVELARRLLALHPGFDDGRIFYTTSGSGANDMAGKLSRRFAALHGRPASRLVSFRDSYHGGLGDAFLLTGEDLGQSDYGLPADPFLHLTTPLDPASSEIALGELADHLPDVAAIFVEPVLGSAGACAVDPAFAAGCTELARRHGFLVVADEVATGFGRTGSMFAYEELGLKPDLVVMSKAVTNGLLPMAAVAVRESVWRRFEREGVELMLGETQAGNPLSCAAALATLDLIEKRGLVDRARRAAQRLERLLRPLEQRHERHGLLLSGRGLMRGIHLRALEQEARTRAGAALAERCRLERVIVHPSPQGITLLPPYVITDDELDVIVSTVDGALDALEGSAC